MTPLTVRVNGDDHSVDVAPSTPLLWLLRDRIGLTGTKYGCGIAQCGACTVLLDGQPVRACVTPVSAIGEASVVTIEGLATDGDHPVQRAWLAEDVPQCGFCQAGQLLTAAALLERNPSPDDGDIDAAMSALICRCGTYDRIRRAIHRAAARAEP